MAPLSVLVVGATGLTGSSIVNALLATPSQFKVTALVRPSSIQAQATQELAARGVAIVKGALEDSVDDLVEKISGQDVVISAVGLTEHEKQYNLVTAAKKTGVKRFIPCAFIPVMAVGFAWIRDSKEAVYNHIKLLGVPYTIIDIGWWFQIWFPSLPSGRIDYARPSVVSEIAGDGTKKSVYTDLRNVGKYVARIVADDRTLNKYVFTDEYVCSQNDIYGMLEKLSGEKIPRDYVSAEELERRFKDARKQLEREGGKLPSFETALSLATPEYLYSIGIRGDSCPEYAKYLGYLLTSELYPDFEKGDFALYLQEVLDGKGERVHGNQDLRFMPKAQY
ncbi:hypothetical protein BKA56DRAFT_496096 [Ilyonectria sp. MPI-CAGE-AT-0026]|nr:hypothetical protein BKA56DRAFT_496096 [Ilyonectria sp. MPI-CAGE-AT-0026]